MAFQIRYETVLTLRCWHPAYLGEAAGLVPVAGPLTPRQEYDYLRYDLRPSLEIRPTTSGAAYLERRGLRWLPTTQGGFLVGPENFAEADGSQVLELGLFPTSGDFAARTDFGTNDINGRYFRLSNSGETPAALLNLNDPVSRLLNFENRPAGVDPTLFGVIQLEPAGWTGSAFDLYFLENTNP